MEMHEPKEDMAMKEHVAYYGQRQLAASALRNITKAVVEWSSLTRGSGL